MTRIIGLYLLKKNKIITFIGKELQITILIFETFLIILSSFVPNNFMHNGNPKAKNPHRQQIKTQDGLKNS